MHICICIVDSGKGRQHCYQRGVARASTQLAVAKLLRRFRYICLACLALYLSTYPPPYQSTPYQTISRTSLVTQFSHLSSTDQSYCNASCIVRPAAWPLVCPQSTNPPPIRPPSHTIPTFLIVLTSCPPLGIQAQQLYPHKYKEEKQQCKV